MTNPNGNTRHPGRREIAEDLFRDHLDLGRISQVVAETKPVETASEDLRPVASEQPSPADDAALPAPPSADQPTVAAVSARGGRPHVYGKWAAALATLAILGPVGFLATGSGDKAGGAGLAFAAGIAAPQQPGAAAVTSPGTVRADTPVAAAPISLRLSQAPAADALPSSGAAFGVPASPARSAAAPRADVVLATAAAPVADLSRSPEPAARAIPRPKPAVLADNAFRPSAVADRPAVVLARAEDGVPSAGEIWRHLPDGPARPASPPAEPTPETAAVMAPSPASREERPTPAPEAAPRQVRPVPAPAPEPAPAPAVRQADRSLSNARIVIHYPASAGPAASQDLARRLRNAGSGEVEIRRVPFQVSRQSVRFFHNSDRAVSEQVGALIRSGRRTDVADFTHYAPLPRNGTVEIWLP